MKSLPPGTARTSPTTSSSSPREGCSPWRRAGRRTATRRARIGACGATRRTSGSSTRAKSSPSTSHARRAARWCWVGLYKLNPIVTHSLKAPGFNPCAYKVKNRFQSLLSNSTCTATAGRRHPQLRDGLGDGHVPEVPGQRAAVHVRGVAPRHGAPLRVLVDFDKGAWLCVYGTTNI
jgi:hypothetical protein